MDGQAGEQPTDDAVASAKMVLDAARAVRLQRPGRDPAVVRTALEEELARRGVTDPDPRSVDNAVRATVAAQGPLGLLRVGRELWRGFGELRRTLKENEPPDWLKPPPGIELRVFGWHFERGSDCGPNLVGVEVDLADEAQPFLARAYEALRDPRWPDEDQVGAKVWLDSSPSSRSFTQPRLFLGQEFIGTLTSDDAAGLEHDLRRAARKKQPLILKATLERDGQGLSAWVTVPAA